MQQCDKLQTTVEMMSTECTLLRCLRKPAGALCRRDAREEELRAGLSDDQEQRRQGIRRGRRLPRLLRRALPRFTATRRSRESRRW